METFMYDKILITLDATAADRAIIEHVKHLAAVMKSRVVLLHVATGVPVKFHGADACGQEVEEDRAYLDGARNEFEAAGIEVEAELTFGEPVREIVKWVEAEGCDLVAMSTHGHKALGDLMFGATASKVQHNLSVPVLLLRAK